MKPHLLHRDREFDWAQPLPWNSDDLTVDLDLDPLLDAMAAGDPFIREVTQRVLLAGLDRTDEIRYRQAVLADCLHASGPIVELYATVVDILDGERRVHHFAVGRSARAVLTRAVDGLDYLTGRLRQLHQFARRHRDDFRSEGLRTLLTELIDQVGDDYLDVLDHQLDHLRLRSGVVVSAELGRGNHGARYRLHLPPPPPSWWQRLLAAFGPAPPHTLVIADRDEAGSRALTELGDRGINPIANALSQAADHVLAFLQALRRELAFYLGGVNLHIALVRHAVPVCFPEPADEGADLQAERLCEATLALRAPRPPVVNDVAADGRGLIAITGPNQGGKSTLLRAVGQAMMLLRAGLFVTAGRLRATVPGAVVTHFGRGEDPAMRGGKFDEELRRMDGIVDHLRPGWCVLLNEPFATTNAREGSEIGADIVRALLDRRIRVVLVTHLFDLAEQLRRDRCDAVFLRAERRPDGRRTFLVRPGDPEPTSNGADLYDRIFGRSGSEVGASEGAPA